MSLLTDLAAYYKLDEASGNALDAVGSSDLADSGSVGSTTGKVGNARDFEASSNQYFSRASNSAIQAGDVDFTISCWVKLESTGTPMMLVAKDTSGSREYFLSYGNNGDQFSFCVFDYSQTPREILRSAGSPSAGTWYHLVGWHDSANNEVGLAVNAGTPDVVSHTSGIYPGSAEFRIGARQYPGYLDCTDGLIDEVGLWKRVLTSQERADLYNGGAGLAYSAFGGGTTIEPASIPSAESVGSPTLAPGPVSVAPGSIASAGSVGSPTLTPGAVTVSPVGIASGESVGSPTVTPGPVAVAPTSIPSAESVGGPTLSSGASAIVPASIPSAESVGPPTLIPGPVVIVPASIGSAEAVGSPSLAGGSVVVIPTSIGSAESVGPPTLTSPGSGIVIPEGIASAESVGAPTLTPGPVYVGPTSIPSAGSVGVPALMPGPVYVAPSSIALAGSVGAPVLTPGTVVVSPASIPFAGSVGSPVLTGGTPSTLPGRARPDPRYCLLRSSDPDPRKVILR